MAKQKIAITLDQTLVSFLDDQVQGNRSDYINSLLHRHREQVLDQQMMTALQEDAANPNYQAEVEAWDIVAGDGLDAEG